MAKVTELTVSLGRTIQVAPYSPLNYHLSYKIELQEEDDIIVETNLARRQLENQVNDYIESFQTEEAIPEIYGSNAPSNSQPATEEQKIFMIKWINKNLPFDQQEEALKKANQMTKKQAIEKIKTLK